MPCCSQATCSRQCQPRVNLGGDFSPALSSSVPITITVLDEKGRELVKRDAMHKQSLQ